jgi:hypothetical protein
MLIFLKHQVITLFLMHGYSDTEYLNQNINVIIFSLQQLKWLHFIVINLTFEKYVLTLPVT